MKINNLLKYTKGKSKVITFKINPELLALLDKALQKDKTIHSRSQLIETSILKYLEDKNLLK